MKRRLFVLTATLLAVGSFLYGPAQALAESAFKTKYTLIHYDQAKDLSDFLWRLGGTRIEFTTDTDLASSRVDRLVERVQTILDMHPKGLTIQIFLKRGELAENPQGFYQRENGTVTLCVDKVTDGIFAHEISHAVINKYFGGTVPRKTQEILSQYVDKYLWNDYS